VKIHSFFRTESFVFVLRGRRLILGEVADLLDGDLQVVGNKRHGILRVSMLDGGGFRLLGGTWARRRYPMPQEVCERLLDSMRLLGADDYFVVLCAMLLTEAPAPTVAPLPASDPAFRRPAQPWPAAQRAAGPAAGNHLGDRWFSSQVRFGRSTGSTARQEPRVDQRRTRNQPGRKCPGKTGTLTTGALGRSGGNAASTAHASALPRG
jgi:hypothetical protein